MTPENFAVILLEWMLRSTLLACAAAAMMGLLRVKDLPIRLAVWTAVLAGCLLMPVISVEAPAIGIQVPSLFGAAPVAPQHTVWNGAKLPLSVAVPGSGLELNWPVTILSLWALGTFAMLLRLASGLYFTCRLVRGATEVMPGVLECAAVTVPATVGAWKPTILLPPDWGTWDASKLAAALEHERAHVRGRDPLRRIAALLFRALCWFHPLSWWLSRKLSELSEARSDDAALAQVPDEAGYAETLLGFWERTPRRVRWEGVAMARGGTLSKRMERILDGERRRSVALARGAWVAIALLAVPIIYIGAAARPVLAAPQATTDDKYSRWLNEEVPYIITAREKDAFESLGTDAERDHFVEQFWDRRNPSPGAAENAFKSEHYRRISYANAHFVDARPGWQTDRGRIYIIYGPPDELEVHKGRFDWRYRTGATWTFIDSEGIGEYKLVPSADAVRNPVAVK